MKRIPTCHERRLEAFNPIKIIKLSRKPAVAPAKGNGFTWAFDFQTCMRSKLNFARYLPRRRTENKSAALTARAFKSLEWYVRFSSFQLPFPSRFTLDFSYSTPEQFL